MAENDSVNDRYNPPSIDQMDFQSAKFDDLEINDLFWLEDNLNNSNHAYRKLNENQSLNTITRHVIEGNFNRNTLYQKI